MSDRLPRKAFASRPVDPESWVRAGKAPPKGKGDAAGFTARLTIDVTPDQRARIKITAFERGVTVAGMLRDLLRREFPPSDGETP